ncbi:hypothetical protein C0W93_04755 [Photobacterium leiognathi subsp. mandapamensis]|uniref:Uncharacterized protein n=1 Tax=Photobacterium leiognathi subsp. mandapamensis TaxID=48408 RepID=A0A2T3KYZ7_PHOLD|nr:hypothetical protein [Photobacterium leiognathi]PSV13030.1 hypothetical protein C0W93_04755 [Photobacterium leiognathi subsp. mandapamensis]
MHQIVECADYFLDISELSEPQYERIQNELLLREICIDELGSKVTVKDIQHMLSLSGFKLTRYLVGNYDYKYIIQRFGLRDIKGGKYNCNLYEKEDFRVCLKSYIPGIRLKIFSFQKIIDKLRRIIKQTDNRMIKEKAYKLIFSIRLYQYTYLEKGVNVGPKHVKHTDFEKFKRNFDFSGDEHIYLEKMIDKYQSKLFHRWFTNIIPLSVENFKYYLLSFNEENIDEQLGLHLDNSRKIFQEAVSGIRKNIMSHRYIDISWRGEARPIPVPVKKIITDWQKQKEDKELREDDTKNEIGTIYFFTFEENGFFI